MQYVNQVAGTIVDDYATRKVGEQLGYLFHYKSNIKKLKEQVVNLEERGKKVQQQIHKAEDNLETIEDEVQHWIEGIDVIISDTKKFLEADKEKANHRCFNWWCINLSARYKFGKEAFEKAGEITKLHETKFETVSYCPPLSDIVSYSSSKMFDGFESRKTKVKEIMKALDDENINVVGICGMGGVGKTTIVEEVGRQAKTEKKFDKVVMVVVSQTPDLAKIQEKVASELGLDALKTMEESKRAFALWERIKREKKILLVLDDVWSRLELKKIGIPFAEDHKGCKIMLTSLSEDVCSEMDAQKTFPIQVLPEPEAWALFRDMVGEKDADSSDLSRTAREVARGCRGLPIAIVTVGRALKNRRKDVWVDAARKLKKPIPKNIEGMDAFVYSRLELSYNYLESEEAKSLFLLCSLFPEDADISVEQLVLYGMGLRLFQDVETIEDARVSARALVSTLRSSFLLLETTDERYVKMHDAVRDVAIVIASKEEENKFMVKAKIGLRDWPNNGTPFRNYLAISLMKNDIHELPDALEFPKLQTLLLQGNSLESNFEIPSNFFQGMKDLKVLDMSGNKIRSLPPSITLLTALQTLCLESCNVIGDVSMIGTLKQLEILSLFGSFIEEVPRHFTQLTHLRLFDLRDCWRLKQIAPGVISSLRKLEELYIGSSFTNWVVEGGEENSSSSASVAELTSLSRLSSLSVGVPNADMLPSDLNFQNLIRFDISIGNTETPPVLLKKTLGLTYHTRLSGPVEVLLKTTEGLLLHDCIGLKNIFKDLDSGGFGGLKKMMINGCYDMKYLLDPIDHGAPRAAFCNLEELWLRSLYNFSEICHGQLPSESFSQVRKLEVFYCGSMSNIVPSNLLSRIQYVEVVRAGYCNSLLNVFDLEGLATEGGETELLSRLEVLFLRKLDGLMHIWNGSNHFVKLCNLRSVTTWFCTKIRQLFPPSLVQGLVHLEDLDVWSCELLDEIFGTREEERIDQIVVVGESLGMSTRLQNLTTVKVGWCERLRTIFPPSVAKGLVQLHKLYIENCAMMEAVIEHEKAEAAVSTTEKIVFPYLYSITLDKLGSLACFYTSRYAVEYPSLEQVIICDCPKMETFGHGIQMTPKLKTVHLDISGEDEGIWMGDLNATVQHIFNQKAKPLEQGSQPVTV